MSCRVCHKVAKHLDVALYHVFKHQCELLESGPNHTSPCVQPWIQPQHPPRMPRPGHSRGSDYACQHIGGPPVIPALPSNTQTTLPPLNAAPLSRSSTTPLCEDTFLFMTGLCMSSSSVHKLERDSFAHVPVVW